MFSKDQFEQMLAEGRRVLGEEGLKTLFQIADESARQIIEVTAPIINQMKDDVFKIVTNEAVKNISSLLSNPFAGDHDKELLCKALNIAIKKCEELINNQTAIDECAELVNNQKENSND